MKSTFRSDFAWGAATAAYQIEGAAETAGRAASIWDVQCRKPNAIWRGETGERACDHYHLMAADVALMKDLGLKAYRFSISWSRVLPLGTGAVNEPGLEFYDRLVDALLEAGISPWLTLYHWDLPQELFVRGGWLNPEIPDWFAHYTRVMVDRLSDRVTNWITLNEPQCFVGLAMERGVHAPGMRLARAEVLLAAHHALLAHGRAVEVIRERAKKPPQIGWAPVGVTATPHTENDVEAARLAMFSHAHRHLIVNPWDETCVWGNAWWGDPVVHGHYPEDALAAFGNDVPKYTAEEMKTIAAPIDFYGANIYHGIPVTQTDKGLEAIVDAQGCPRTLLGWTVSPGALYWGPKLLQERYGLPIVITENGVACHDWVDLDGRVSDPQRIDFTRRYLRELRRAVADGVDIRGYFHWTFMDNFEWAEGFKQRLGLVHVNFDTLERTPKDSFAWYREVIASNGDSL